MPAPLEIGRLLQPWLIALIAGIAAVLLLRRWWRLRRLMILGAAVPRVYLMILYLYFQFATPDSDARAIPARVGIFILLFTEIFYNTIRIIARRDRDELDI